MDTLSLYRDYLPAFTLYPEEVASLLNRGRLVAEVGGLEVTDRKGPSTIKNLARSVIEEALALNVTDILVMVNPRHVKWYCREFPFKTFGPTRFYPRVGKPAVLLHLDLAANRSLALEFIRALNS